VSKRARRELFPELAACAERGPTGLHARTPLERRLGPAGKSARDQRLELGAQRLGEHRRGAVGRHADDERRAVDDRSEGEIAIGRLVDDVDRHARDTRRGGKTRGLGPVAEVADRDGSAGAVGRRPGARVDRDGAARRSACQSQELG